VGHTRLIDNLILHRRQAIIAIDGPAGAGKSTVTRKIAQALGLLYLDTGAMYRAVTWLVLQSGIAVEDEVAIAEIVSKCRIELIPDGEQPRTLINGQDVTEAIRSLEVTAQVSAIAAQWAVRQALVKQQQAFGNKGGIVAEGRDIGTTVFPDAELKIFLTASVQERAKRRLLELHSQGKTEITQEQLEQDIAERDRLDSNRVISPLRKAADAMEIQTDNLTIDDVIQRVVKSVIS
jgi:pantoate ligase/cytidylate kinase